MKGILIRLLKENVPKNTLRIRTNLLICLHRIALVRRLPRNGCGALNHGRKIKIYLAKEDQEGKKDVSKVNQLLCMEDLWHRN